MSKEERKPERETPSTVAKEAPRPEKPRGSEAEGTWANLVRVRKNAKGG